MHQLTKDELRELLEKSYRGGWESSSKSWNGEIPKNADLTRVWEVERDEFINGLLGEGNGQN